MRVPACVLPLLVLAAACSAAPESAPAPRKPLEYGAAPKVRVLLASLGKPQEVLVRGEKLEFRAGERTLLRTKKGLLARQGDSLSLDGEPIGVDRITVSASGLVQVEESTYSGTIEISVDEHLVIVNHVTIEDYVLGVLRGELPLKEVPPAAAAAQAIAVRSYTLHYLALERDGFDLDDTTLYQRYVGFRRAPDDQHLRDGVLATIGQYLVRADNSEPLKAYYHSTCGGHTTDPQRGLSADDTTPMRGVACEHCRASKYWRWEGRLESGAIAKAAGMGTATPRDVQVSERTPHGRARAFLIITNDGAKSVPANEFRLSVGPSALRSTRVLEIERNGGSFTFRGGGWGHGVGLCQMGAIGLAKKGKSGEEIVRYYYRDAEIRRAY